MWGFGLAFFGLVLGGFAIQNDWKILMVVGACILMWGHYWDASNGMTIASMVAPTRFRDGGRVRLRLCQGSRLLWRLRLPAPQ